MKHKQFILLIICIAMTIWSCKEDDGKKEDVKQGLLDEVNKLRSEGCTCGNDVMPPVDALKWNTTLEAAAISHAKDMATREYFNHISPDGSAPVDRAQAAGYEGEYVGENIARYYYKTSSVVKGWKESESHCKAMMDPLYHEMGGGNFKYYWVLDFGKPL